MGSRSAGPWWILTVLLAMPLVAGVLFTAMTSQGSHGNRPAIAASPSPSATTPAATDAPDPIPVTVITWNMCGSDGGTCPDRPASVLADAVVEAVRTQRADAVLLQEACGRVVRALADELGPKWRVHFRQAKFASVVDGVHKLTPAKCAGGLGEYGQVVAVRSALGQHEPARPGVDRERVWLRQLTSPEVVPGKRVEQRFALCVRMPAARIQLCTAHFSTRQQDPGGEIRAAQAEQFGDETRMAQVRGYSTIVGGDLNTSPSATVEATGQPILQPLYVQGNECDPAEEQKTFGDVKIDYLFASAGLSLIGCEATPSELSDHRMLTARYDFTPDSNSQVGAEPH